MSVSPCMVSPPPLTVPGAQTGLGAPQGGTAAKRAPKDWSLLAEPGGGWPWDAESLQSAVRWVLSR